VDLRKFIDKSLINYGKILTIFINAKLDVENYANLLYAAL